MILFRYIEPPSVTIHGISFLMSLVTLVDENCASRFVWSIDIVFEATLLAGVLCEESDISVSPGLVTFG
jgi:hypothetical protein